MARAAFVAAAAGLVVFGLMRLPFSDLPLAVGSLAVGGVSALPFIWPELKLLVKL
jgi:hypothetical protein